MSYERLPYDDQDSALKMASDCGACATAMHRPGQVDVSAALEVPPSIGFDAFPTDLPKPVITIDEATAHLAARLHLHLD